MEFLSGNFLCETIVPKEELKSLEWLLATGLA